MSNYLKIELDQAYTVALKYPTPRPVNGFRGPELRWCLMDGRGLFTPPEFRAEVEALRLKPGQKFTVSKVRENGRVKWKAQTFAQPAASLLDGVGSLDSPVPSEMPAKMPSSRLERALITAVSAAADAEAEAHAIGYNVRFTPADIRAMAISVLIGMQRDAA